MRISTAWNHQLGVNALLAQQAKLSKTQLQLSSGQKQLTPADDPIAAGRSLVLQDSIDRTAQYQKNIVAARVRLGIEESSLEGAENILFRAKELTVQALNAPLNEKDRLSIKYEIDELLDNMVGIANTRNASGEYIFSGDLSTVPPFKWHGDANEFVYQGGVNQRALDIAPERQVADGDLGSEVFQMVATVSQEGDATVNGQALKKRSIMDTLQTLSEALGNAYDIPSAAITGNRFARYGADYSATATSFDLSDDTGNTVTVSLNANYTSLDDVVAALNAQLSGNNMRAIALGNRLQFVSETRGGGSSVQITAGTGTFLADFGFASGDSAAGIDLGGEIAGQTMLGFPSTYDAAPASFELAAADGNKAVINLSSAHADLNALVTDIQGQIDASPLAGQIRVDPSANPLQFKSVSNGAASAVTIRDISGSFLADGGFVDGQTGRVFDKTVNDVLTDLDSGLESLLKARTRVGARLNALDDQASQNETYTLDSEATLSEVRDLDYAEAISRFNQQTTALQAAQQAYARTQNLSLFNFL